MVEKYPIPNGINAIIVAFQLFSIVTCLTLLPNVAGWGLLGLGCAFAILMNSVYSTIHEAHHRILFSHRRINDLIGIILATFFPAPFHLLRQGHLGHHRRNRSDDEAFDLYFEYDNKILKHFAWYGILTGLYWVMVVATNFVLILAPIILRPRFWKWDRTSEVFLNHFDRSTFPIMQLEALVIVVTHWMIITLFDIPLLNYLLMYYCFGLLWSSLQYVHHYQAERDVRNGAFNLKTLDLMDYIFLNHNWHKTHHQFPCVPWLYLRRIAAENETESTSLLPAYFRMWRGPRSAEQSVKNLMTEELTR